MKKFLTLTIIALIALIGLSVSVNAAEVGTIDDLKNALLTDGTIKLTGNIEITESIRTKTNVTVDLNGFKITGPDDGKANWYAFIVEGGVFTLKDSSTAQTGEIYGKCYGIETKAGTFVMESGKITATQNTTFGAAIVNYGGKVEVKGGTLVAAISALDVETVFSNAEVVISGGTFETTTTTDEGAAVTIGGEYSQNGENVVINGGTFKGIKSLSVISEATVEINGGTFSTDVSKYLPEGAIAEYDGKGNYIVRVALDTPTNLKWDGTTAKWDAVPNASSYDLIILNEKWVIAEPLNTKNTSFDFAEYLTDENEEYIFVVIALSDNDKYLRSMPAESDAYVFPVEEDKGEEKPTTGEGATGTESTPVEDKEDKKDETPTTGSVDVVLFASAIVAVISVAGIVTVKKYTR